MISKQDIINIENLFDNKKIIHSEFLSNSFNINCVKFITSDKKKYIVKYYQKKKDSFNAIKSEAKNLRFFESLKKNYFPKIYVSNNNYLVMSYLDNNNKLPSNTKKDLLDAISFMHSQKKNKFGFDFDTQIGGLKHKNNFDINWVRFFRDTRINYIYELINKSNPMENEVNKKMDLLIKKLENIIPQNPKASLLHGDLWEGNILFNNYKFVGFIDPGSFYGHNEMEVAYLRWFKPKFIDNIFLKKYEDLIKLDKNYFSYEPVYQLYYCLLNVYLWDRSYILNTKNLLKKLKI